AITGRHLSGITVLAPYQLIKIMRMRSATVAWCYNNPESDKRFNPTCRFGCSQPEGMSHILGGCNELHRLKWYNKRHNDALEQISNLLRDAELEVHLEQTFKKNGRDYKPDMI